MRISNGIKLFGFFKGEPYGDDCDENIGDYVHFKNQIDKGTIIEYIENLTIAYTSGHTYDMFTGKDLGNPGLFLDPPYHFPVDFLHYYKEYDIGIPPEYEQHIIKKLGLK